MTKSRKIGALGLNIPVIKPSNGSKTTMTAAEVTKWRAALPMADIGLASKKLYIALSELNKTVLDPVNRFEIIELFRPTTKTIATALKKHYIEQAEPLTPQKLTIAALRQTLISEMADSYKIILEELNHKPNKTEQEKRIIVTTVCRILYYLNSFLLCRYQIYSSIPENVWHEVYILYRYGLTRNILDLEVRCELSLNHSTSILGAFTRIILLSATDPYQWRQKDQYSINKAIDLWSVFPTIYDYANMPEKNNGIFIIDLNSDHPPIPYNFKRDPVTPSCIALDVARNVKHLKLLLLKMHKHEMKLRIEHPGDPEFSVTIPTLVKLIQIWSQRITRNMQRFRISAKIKVAFGLRTAYYYINNQKEFDPRPRHLNTPVNNRQAGALTRPSLELPIFEIEDEFEELDIETKDSEISTESKDDATIIEAVVDIEQHYKLYEYELENISTNGFCIHINDGSFPPFRTGEIMIFKNSTEPQDAPWSIGAVRWIKSPSSGVFQMGIELVAPFSKAAGIQMIRNEQPVGLLLRCLVLPDEPDTHAQSVLITPTLPLHSNRVILYLDHQEGIKTTLVKELESTSGYHKYVYSMKENINIGEHKADGDAPEQNTETPSPNNDDDKTNTEFDSIWKDL